MNPVPLEMSKIFVAGYLSNKEDEFVKRISQFNEKAKGFDLIIAWYDGPAKFDIPKDLHLVLLSKRKLDTNVKNIHGYGVHEYNGVRIAYIADMDLFTESQEFTFGIVDILLCDKWPLGIEKGSSMFPENPSNSINARELVKRIRPRYIFSCEHDIFIEREPFKNKDYHDTRFISLANFPSKERFYYACKIEPVSELTELKTSPDATDNPFISKRVLGDDSKVICSKPGDGYVCKKCSSTDHFFKDCPKREEYICHACNEPGHHIKRCPQRKKARQDVIQSCWFCLSNAQAEKHLIVDVSTKVYVALSKGGIVKFHLLIVPIEHVRMKDPKSEELQADFELMLGKIGEALFRLNLGFISFEIKHDLSYHSNIQVIPIPISEIDRLSQFLKTFGQNEGITFITEEPKTESFLRIRLSNGQVLVHEIKDSYFNINFGRSAVTKFLKVEDRQNWKNCIGTVEEEISEANELKALLRQ